MALFESFSTGFFFWFIVCVTRNYEHRRGRAGGRRAVVLEGGDLALGGVRRGVGDGHRDRGPAGGVVGVGRELAASVDGVLLGEHAGALDLRHDHLLLVKVRRRE